MMIRMKRVTVSLPDDVAEAAKHAADETGAANFSVYVTDALRAFTERETFAAIYADMEAEHGPTSAESKAQAEKILNEVFGPESTAQGAPRHGSDRDARLAG